MYYSTLNNLFFTYLKKESGRISKKCKSVCLVFSSSRTINVLTEEEAMEREECEGGTDYRGEITRALQPDEEDGSKKDL